MVLIKNYYFCLCYSYVNYFFQLCFDLSEENECHTCSQVIGVVQYIVKICLKIKYMHDFGKFSWQFGHVTV